MLVNNNYSNRTIDHHIEKFINNKLHSTPTTPTNKITVYYQNQMHNNYKIDERVIKSIIKNHTSCIKDNMKLNTIIYYRSKKTCNLVMKNNISPAITEAQKSHCVYKFDCFIQGYKPEEYIGYTETSLIKRLTSHTYNGSIKQHLMTKHNTQPTKELLLNNTKIIAYADTKYKLLIKEALLIQKHAPSINKQFDTFPNILKLHKHRRPHGTLNSMHNDSQNLTIATNTISPNQHMHSSSLVDTPTHALQNNDTLLFPPQALPSQLNLNNTNNNNYTIGTVSPNISNRIHSLIHSTRNNSMTLRSGRIIHNNNATPLPPPTYQNTYSQVGLHYSVAPAPPSSQQV